MLTTLLPGQKPPEEFEYVIPSTNEESERIEKTLLARLEELGWDERHCFAVRLAMEEALVNAIKHGNCMDAGKKIKIQYQINGLSIHIEIEDEGEGFEPEAVPDPTLDENLERPCGRGIMLIRSFMRSVKFSNRGRRLIMDGPQLPVL